MGFLVGGDRAILGRLLWLEGREVEARRWMIVIVGL